MKVQVERFHMNSHTIAFRPQTQKLEPPYKTPLITLAVKGLNQPLSECSIENTLNPFCINKQNIARFPSVNNMSIKKKF